MFKVSIVFFLSILNVPQRDILKVCNALISMGVDKYACFILYVCPEQRQILSRIFSRITSRVLHAQKVCWKH